MKFQPHDKVRIITAPPQLAHLTGRELFISQIPPTRPGDGLPRATLLLGAGETVELSTVFLQLVKRCEIEAPLVETLPRPDQWQKSPLKLPPAGEKRLAEKGGLTRAQNIKLGQQRRADELGITLEQYFARASAKRAETRSRKEIERVGAAPESANPPEPKAPPEPLEAQAALTCRKCGGKAQRLAGITRCDLYPDGRRCGGVLE